MITLNKELSITRSKINLKRKQEIFYDLSLLLDSGIDIITAFQILQDSAEKKNVSEELNTIKKKLISGVPIFQAFKNSNNFSIYDYQSIKIGEESGNFVVVLNQLSTYYKDILNLRQKLINALTYPFVILFTALLVTFFMLTYIVPMFEGIFIRVGRDLPEITKIILNFSHNFPGFLISFFLLSLFIVFLDKYLKNDVRYKSFIGNSILKFPLIGDMVRKSYMSKFCISMELMIMSHVPLIKAIELSREMIDFLPFQYALSDIKEGLIKGLSLSTMLQKNNLFDKRMTAMIKVAEETNQLGKVFSRLKEQYINELAHKSSILGNLLEPVIVIFIGIFVAIILIAMYLPMFELNNSNF